MWETRWQSLFFWSILCIINSPVYWFFHCWPTESHSNLHIQRWSEIFATESTCQRKQILFSLLLVLVVQIVHYCMSTQLLLFWAFLASVPDFCSVNLLHETTHDVSRCQFVSWTKDNCVLYILLLSQTVIRWLVSHAENIDNDDASLSAILHTSCCPLSSTLVQVTVKTYHSSVPHHRHPLLNPIDSLWYKSEVVFPDSFLSSGEAGLSAGRHLEISAARSKQDRVSPKKPNMLRWNM